MAHKKCLQILHSTVKNNIFCRESKIGSIIENCGHIVYSKLVDGRVYALVDYKLEYKI